jgi:hypothetical protein
MPQRWLHCESSCTPPSSALATHQFRAITFRMGCGTQSGREPKLRASLQLRKRLLLGGLAGGQSCCRLTNKAMLSTLRLTNSKPLSQRQLVLETMPGHSATLLKCCRATKQRERLQLLSE